LTGIDSEKTLAMDVCEEKESIKVKQINEEREEEKPTMKQTNSHQGHFLTHQTCTRLSRFFFFFVLFSFYQARSGGITRVS